MAGRAGREGQQLGNYKLLRLLGIGGFADVYLGEHLYLKSQAAVKVLHTVLAEEDMEGFLVEARRLVSLRHPHIVRVLDFAIQEQVPFLVMEYVPNGSLRTRYPKGSRLPLEIIVSYVRQVADALQYTHDKKLVHRDVKPENILLRTNDEIVLSDFGIAAISHATGSLILQGQAGTPAYMAPEQIHKLPRPASDQYALGIVVYEWLCGTRPFDGSSMSVIYQHLQTPPPPLCQHIPTIPPILDEVVLKALSKSPHDRYDTVQDFAAVLEQAYQQVKHSDLAKPSVLTSSQDPTTAPLSLPSVDLENPPLRMAPSSPRTAIANLSTYTLEEQGGNPSVSGIMSSPSFETPTTISRRIPRRQVFLGLGLAGLAITGAGLTWLVSSRISPPSFPKRQSPIPVPPVGTLLYTYRGHTNGVAGIAWSPDGNRIASASTDKTVQVWNAANGGHSYTYRGHVADVWAVAWSPDGQHISSASNDGIVQVWNAANGSQIYTFRGHTDAVSAVAWSPDSKHLASSSRDHTVQIWSMTTGANVFTYRKHADWVHAVAWSPDGTRIASGSDDTTIQVWNVSDGNRILTYQGSSGISTVSWSPGGLFIASGANGQYIISEDYTVVYVWNATNGTNLFAYRGHSEPLNSVVWSPDGKHIASASWDRTIQIWNSTDGMHIFTYREYLHDQYTSIFALAWSPDGQRIASGGNDSTIRIWRAT